MKQVVQDVKGGKVKVVEVPLPACGAGEVLVRVEASLISAGTEKMVMNFAKKGLLGKARERPDLVRKVLAKMKKDGVADTLAAVFTQLGDPLPLGYSMAGEVVAVGRDLQNTYKVGDRVAGAGAGIANHAEYVALPKNLVVKVPEGVPAADACYATLGAIALHGVRNAGVGIGDRVLVVGLGLVGQLAVQVATAAGARVAALDVNRARCDLAVQGGAVLAVLPDEEGRLAEVHEGRGFDAVLLCAATDSDELMQKAAELARDRARVVLVGKVGTRFDYAAYMKKELTVGVSRSYGAGRYDPAFEQRGLSYPAGYVPHTERDNLAEIVRLVALGRVQPRLLTTHVFGFDKALKAYDFIGKGKEPFLGVVLAYGGEAPKQPKVVVVPPTLGRQEVGIGVVGVGAFTKSVMLPALAKVRGARILRLVSKGGLSAATARQRHARHAIAGTDMQELWQDEAVHGVMVMTRHNQHAGMVTEALKHGKDVWVEKPLAMNADELAMLDKAYEAAVKARAAEGGNPPVVMVGYNRRFSPFVAPLKAEADKRVGVDGARQVVIRVNAGRLDDGNWQNSEEGGGRLLGEVCHFIDLAIFMAGSAEGGRVVNWHKSVGDGQDVYAITLEHANGSISQIVYASEGDSAASKERLEIFAGGGFGMMDNYKATTWSVGGKVHVLARRRFWQRPDKGHKAALAAWVKALQGEESNLPAFAELVGGTQVLVEIAG